MERWAERRKSEIRPANHRRPIFARLILSHFTCIWCIQNLTSPHYFYPPYPGLCRSIRKRLWLFEILEIAVSSIDGGPFHVKGRKEGAAWHYVQEMPPRKANSQWMPWPKKSTRKLHNCEQPTTDQVLKVTWPEKFSFVPLPFSTHLRD